MEMDRPQEPTQSSGLTQKGLVHLKVVPGGSSLFCPCVVKKTVGDIYYVYLQVYETRLILSSKTSCLL
jgi:hypothetical protein